MRYLKRFPVASCLRTARGRTAGDFRAQRHHVGNPPAPFPFHVGRQTDDFEEPPEVVEYLRHQMAKATDPLDAVRRWIAGILTQAADRGAAERTRPFALNSLRLAHQFPEDSRRSAELLQAPLREALEGVAGADPVADADAIYQLTMGRTQAALVQRRRPSKDEIAHTCAFAVGGLRR